jgi:hypothetical protein
MPNRMPSLAALLTADDDKPADVLIHPLAQADMLREAYAQLTAPGPRLEVGELCRQKSMFRFLKPHYRTVFVVLRRLGDSEFDRRLIAEYLRESHTKMTAAGLDVVCGDVATADGKVMAYSLQNSATLERVDAAELADWPLPPAEPK